MRTFFIIISTLLIGHANIVFASSEALQVKKYILQDNPLNGPKKDYYPNGKISREYVLDNGKVNGWYKSFNEKGLLISEQYLIDGVPNGYLKTYFENGHIRSETNFENGIPKGKSKEYYESGALKTDSYLTGEPWEYTGYTNLYYENGSKQAETKVAMGKLEISISYDKQGRVTSEESDGKNISYWYENNGKKHTVINGVEQK